MEDVPLIEAASAASDGHSDASDAAAASFELSGPQGPVIAFRTTSGSVTEVHLEDLLVVVSLLETAVILWLAWREIQS